MRRREKKESHGERRKRARNGERGTTKERREIEDRLGHKKKMTGRE